MNDYGRDRYLPPTPAEDAERERAEILDARAEALADAMIDTQETCPVTGTTLDHVVGELDDARLAEYTRLTFACAAGNSAAPILLRALLRVEAKGLILDSLTTDAFDAEEDARLERALNRGAA